MSATDSQGNAVRPGTASYHEARAELMGDEAIWTYVCRMCATSSQGIAGVRPTGWYSDELCTASCAESCADEWAWR